MYKENILHTVAHRQTKMETFDIENQMKSRWSPIFPPASATAVGGGAVAVAAYQRHRQQQGSAGKKVPG